MENQFQKKCNICEKDLIKEDLVLRTPMDYLFACKEHREYALYPNLHIAKKMAGMQEYKAEDTKCMICDVNLTEEELSTVGKQTMNFVCTKHKEVEGWQQMDMAKKWCEYKEKVNPNAQYQNEKDRNAFRDWWEKNQK